jgi:hypothetical protein
MKNFVKFLEFLEDQNACSPALSWVEGQMKDHPQDEGHTLAGLWDDCPRADWMFWLVRKVGLVDAEDARELFLASVQVVLDTVRYDDELGLNMALGTDDRDFWDIVTRAQRWIEEANLGDEPGIRFAIREVSEHRALELPQPPFKARVMRGEAITALRKLESGNSWHSMLDDILSLCGDWGWRGGKEGPHMRKLSAVIGGKYEWEKVARAIGGFTE